MTEGEKKPTENVQNEALQQPKPSRGALKLEVSTSTPVVEAGSEFSIFVVIRNPFPVSAKIYSTKTHIPVKLSDELSRRWEISKIKNDRQRQMLEMATWYKKAGFRIYYMCADIINFFKSDFGSRVAVAVSTDTTGRVEANTPLYIYGDANIGGDFVGRDRLHLEFGNKSDEEIRQILWEVDEFRLGRTVTLLRAGDSVVNHFVIKTTSWLFFTPIAHTFQIQVHYEVDGHDHLDTIPYSLNIRSSPLSSMIGSGIGAILGAFVNSYTKVGPLVLQDLFQTMLISTVFAVVVVIAFARKSNVQQIVSIEDFWGGIFIGFLVGYSGESFFESILSVGNIGSP